MSRILTMKRELSVAAITGKRIIYFVTDEHDILRELFDEASEAIGRLSGTTIKNYESAVENRVLVDGAMTYGTSRTLCFEKEDKRFCKKCQVLIESNVLAPCTAISNFQLFATEDKVNSACHFINQFLYRANEAINKGHKRSILFLISPQLISLEGFERDIAVIYVPALSREEIADLFVKRADKLLEDGEYCKNESKIVSNAHEMATHYLGLSYLQINSAAIRLEDQYGVGAYLPDDLLELDRNELQESIKFYALQLRKESAQMDNTITFKSTKSNLKGMKGYTDWLNKNERDLLYPNEAKKAGGRAPRGVVFGGLPGSGKTEAAKHTAETLKVPLIELRMDNLLSKFVGKSEARFKQYRHKVESLAPCVVLIDEIEKTFGDSDDGGGGGSQEVKKHLMQALLDWLQEAKEGIFFFATCNSLKGLEKFPELFREGRFSLKCSVFMPSYDALLEILVAHIQAAQNRIIENGGSTKFAGDIEQDSNIAAKKFLDKITKDIREGKDYFYTGANAENIIILTQNAFNRNEQKIYTANDYAEMMYDVATHGESQPYAHTNFWDIIEYWILAYKNQYMDATEVTLFPFDAFVKGNDAIEKDKQINSKFEENKETILALDKHDYNKLMYNRIKNEIIRVYDLNNRDMQNRRRINVN